MDENMKDKEYWYNKVKVNGLMLEKVPMELRTEDVCRAAVYSDSRAFQYVPSKYIDIFLNDIEELGGVNLGWFPEDALTDEIIIASMKEFFFWGDVPESKKTKKVCLEAIKRDACKLSETPEKILDMKFILYTSGKNENI
jgi:hypothetical protein